MAQVTTLAATSTFPVLRSTSSHDNGVQGGTDVVGHPDDKLEWEVPPQEKLDVTIDLDASMTVKFCQDRGRSSVAIPHSNTSQSARHSLFVSSCTVMPTKLRNR